MGDTNISELADSSPSLIEESDSSSSYLRGGDGGEKPGCFERQTDREIDSEI